MGKRQSDRGLEYRCPSCGKKARFGEHFCEVSAAEKGAPSSRFPLKRALSAILALLLIEVFLWQMIGAYSLYSLVLVPAGILAYLGIRRLSLALPSSEYSSLLKMAGNDKDAVERLISIERLKHPGEGRRGHIRSALERWKRDLR
jgi:hypothetical protein